MENKHVLLSSFFPLALPLHYTVQQTETKLGSGCSHSAIGNIHSYITGEFAIYNIPGNTKSNCSPEQQISALLENNKMMKGALVLCPVTSPNELWFGFVAAQEGKLNYSLLKHNGQKMSDGEVVDYKAGPLIRQITCNMLDLGNYYLQLEYVYLSGTQRLAVPFLIT
ncbi:MAG: hypothetical protein KA242_05005 [Chitinophagales bacterium]|nr:hypothetical protein [Chitinophagales bacterium]